MQALFVSKWQGFFLLLKFFSYFDENTGRKERIILDYVAAHKYSGCIGVEVPTSTMPSLGVSSLDLGRQQWRPFFWPVARDAPGDTHARMDGPWRPVPGGSAPQNSTFRDQFQTLAKG